MSKLSFQDLLGKTILVGLSYYAGDQLIEQKQYWGTVVEANETRIRFRQTNGELFSLPPNLESTKPAHKGEYRLCSTGEVVTDPDFTSTWSIYHSPEPEKGS